MRERVNFLKQHSALVSLVIERYNAARLARAGRGEEHAAGLTRVESLCTAHPDSVFAKNYTLCKRLIEEMAFACRERGVLFELGSVPLVYTDEDVARAMQVDPSFNPAFFDEDLAAFAESNGFAYVAMTAGFGARSQAGLTLQWSHWNYQGHQAAFEILLNPGKMPGTPPASNATH